MSRFVRMTRGGKKRGALLALCLALVACITAGVALAYLTARTEPVKNAFDPSFVDAEVEETFDGERKTNVNARNVGDTEAYLRIKLVTYRVNAEDQRIGGTARIPEFELGESWVEHDGFYYYTLPVAPGELPAAPLAAEIPLTGAYSDVDGGKQAIDVIAEAVQSEPARAIAYAWGVAIAPGSVQPAK